MTGTPTGRPKGQRLVFGYADLDRTGLGNMLFPWARCLLWCRRHAVDMLAPRWFHVRIGPWLRRERDKRMYHLLFRDPGWRARAVRTACLLGLPRLTEPGPLDAPRTTRAVYRFRGMEPFFSPLIGYHAVLQRALSAALRPEYLPRGERSRFFAVHVRRGDFTVPASDQVIRAGHHNYQLPLEWYIEALRALRGARACANVPALVFSDGAPEALAALLAEPHTRYVSPTSAATDLLHMASAAALVASGSTFSMWASFLGQVPAIWHPGQRREHVIEGDAAASVEPEWEGGSLPEGFRVTVEGRLNGFTATLAGEV
jgi:hypothetical protein